MPKLLPVAINVRGKACLMIGGGPVAARKVRSLLECEANVTVVAPVLGEELQQIASQIHWQPRGFAGSDCDNQTIVFACTDNPVVNGQVTAEAHIRGILCNIADDPDNSDFHVAAAVRRGEICIGITTGGGSPALAKHLRAKIETAVGEEYAQLLEILIGYRERLIDVESEQENRAGIWRTILANETILNLLRDGRRVDAELHIKEMIDKAAE